MQAKPLRPRPLRKHSWILQVSLLFCFCCHSKPVADEDEERERERVACIFVCFILVSVFVYLFFCEFIFRWISLGFVRALTY